MTKLNVYRACLLTCLAAVVYIWHLSALLILGWWGAAFVGYVAMRFDPPDSENAFHQIGTGGPRGALIAWLGAWNGFYVWRDLDRDYWKDRN